ncbi:ATP-binding protein [Blastococcus sp. URHD0036]|uniref:ATP-binding protein n=1 Tax=Blastococcus sp. URHD0036 TaxID=1380356 RepID=UPI000495A758|nr:ATP-binding protein [Blastococcus sp. URHD0036]
MSATRSLRSRLSWSATAVVALWVVVLTVGANVLLGGVLAREADGVLRARAEAAAATVTEDGGEVRVVDVRDDAALDVGTWIFAADGSAVETPPGSTADLDARAAELAGADGEATAETGLPDRLRLFALPVRDGEQRIATVVTSTSLQPYRKVQRLAWVASAALGVLLLVVVHLVLRANVRRALRPVGAMTAQAGRWSAEDVERRFGTTPRPAELDELARTLDELLDRLGAVLRHERQLSDELSHELRTPLARLQAEVDLLRERPRSTAEQAAALAAIDDAAGSMRRIVETLMVAARTGSGALPGRCHPAEVLPELVRAAVGSSGIEAVADVPADLVVGVDAPVLERLVAPVLANAARYARTRVTVTGESRPGRVRLVIADDGPGVGPADADRVFDAGWRADPGDGHDGAGLGLALARRLARAAGGDIDVGRAGAGGCFVLDLPAG